MGKKGAKMTSKSTEACETFTGSITHLGVITSKKMFGGYGIFESGKMFALVNSDGGVFLKVSDTNRQRFEQSGTKSHGRMPYFQIPDEVMGDPEVLFEWTKLSIDLSKE